MRITKEIMDRYYPEETNVFSEEKMGKLEVPIEIDSSIKYEVIRKDIDLNGHMHNLYYLDLAYEALPEEVYSKRPFNNVRITYKKEIKLGDIVHCNYTNKNGKNIITIESKDGEKSNLHSIIEIY